MANETMRAVIITAPGGVDVLQVKDVPICPAPAADRVRVRVRASSLNRADLLQRMGRYPAPPGFPQEIPGMEFAGEVESVGPEVRRWKVGDRVFGITGGAAHAEFVVVPENHLAAIPPNLDWIQAAAVPEAFITAHDALFTQAGLQIGEVVLVHAVGSGVGLAASQLIHAAGATVIGTSRTAEKLDRAREYGMEHGIAVGDDPSTIASKVRELSHGKGVNVVFDLVGAAYLSASIESLALRGRMLLIGTTSGGQAMLEYGPVMTKRLKVIGTVLRARSQEEKATATRLFEQQVVPLLERGVVRPVVDKIYELKDIRAAHEQMEGNRSFGKIVVVMQ